MQRWGLLLKCGQMSLKRNASGANDPTAYAALKPIVAQETEVESKLHKLIATMKNMANLAGFEVTGTS